MLKIKDYINSEVVDDYTFPDINRIINVCAKHNVEITIEEAEELWLKYSDEYCAQWLILPDSDEYLFEIIIKQAKKIWKKADLVEKVGGDK